ncbi:MAG TPA: type II secretion system F family protein [Actinomycetota bacterium]|jgi:tight adherence protein C|nr:type II secretion system F family protein [Actinomycetota bacterium]
MSEVWLVVAVGCVFGMIVLLGIFLDLNQSERRRAVRLLESQVAGTTSESVNLREQHLSESFSRRILVPIVAGAARISRRLTPLDARDKVVRKLLLAGSPSGWDAERVLAFKIIGLGSGIALAFFLTTLVGDLSPFIRVVMIGLLAFVGFVAPDTLLSRRVEERQREILKTLSDTLDLLTISVEAGLSLNAAIAQVVQNVPGVLSAEFARMLQEIQLGVPRADAFRNLAERTDVEELNTFSLAMIQADVFGVSIASVLRTQAQQLRIKRRQAAEAKAQQTPVKIVFPLILCILPALFIVIVGPGAIRIWESFINA